MEKNLNQISKLAHAREKENEEFRMFLKSYDHHKVDEVVHELNRKYEKFDCTDCGNCCKKLTPVISQEEIKNIASTLDFTFAEFKDKYVDREKNGGYILVGSQCPFLQSNNKCSIYNCRPEVCRSFPHLYKDNINHRLLNIIDNTYICPIVYNIFEDLKKELWNKK